MHLIFHTICTQSVFTNIHVNLENIMSIVKPLQNRSKEVINVVELDKFSTSVRDVVFSLPGMSMMLSPWHLAVVDMQSPEILSSSSSRMVFVLYDCQDEPTLQNYPNSNFPCGKLFQEVGISLCAPLTTQF